MQDIGATRLGDNMGINFRPSPNFKYMRKYLKKPDIAACSGTAFNPNFDEEMTKEGDNKAKYNFVVQPPLPSDPPPPDFSGTAFNPNFDEEITKEGDNKAKFNGAVQPQLPTGTPPPVFPPHIQLKEEVIYDDDTSQKQNVAGSEYDKPKATQSDMGEPKKIMCKDFVRGTCNRAPCSYSHKLDLTQLKGVYKFCRDFANGICKRSVCIFVHASTFEKENFFRTGVLPPHTLSHLKDVAQQPQPVSKVPAQPCVPIYPVNTGNSANTTYSDYNSCAPSLPTAMIVPPAAPIDTGIYSLYTPPQLSPPQVWNEGNGEAIEAEADVPKKCINCNLAKISYIQNKNKLEGIEKFTKKMKENMFALDQKKAKLMTVLTMLLSSQEERSSFSSLYQYRQI